MKPMNMLSWFESTVEARRLISILIMNKSSVMRCCITWLTTYKGAPHKKQFKIELLQYWNVHSCATLLPFGTLFIVIKYSRLKPRLIENKFPHKRLISVNFLGHGTTLVILFVNGRKWTPNPLLSTQFCIHIEIAGIKWVLGLT